MGSVQSFEPNSSDKGASKPHPSKSLEETLVRTEAVIAKKGSIPVSGRYTCSRDLEQDYTLLDTVLGNGMNGDVLLAKGKADGRRYAVKSFQKTGLSTRSRNSLRNEVELYMHLDHPHIAHLHMVFETESAVHMVMEHLEGGELFDRLEKQERFSESDAADSIYQVLLAVAYLHARKIAHRDLKLENFIFQSKDSNLLKLIDFGLAKFWDPTTRMSQVCGSVCYLAPEVLNQSYTLQADMWSVGIISYMLLTGRPLFGGSDAEIVRHIKANKPRLSSKFFKLSNPAQSFIEALLERSPLDRPCAAVALEHPFIKGRDVASGSHIDAGIVGCLRNYAEASCFRRAALCMMAWSLSTEERLELQEQFLLLDVRKRGSIKLRELKQILEENFNVEGSEAERLFSALDYDNSQEIEYSEFLAAALAGRVSTQEDLLRRTFSRFDRNESGIVTPEELREVLGDSFDGSDIEEMIQSVDKSGDGNIAYEEFLDHFRESEQGASGEPATPSDDEKLGTTVDRIICTAEVERGTLAQPQSCKADTLIMPVLLGTASVPAVMAVKVEA